MSEYTVGRKKPGSAISCVCVCVCVAYLLFLLLLAFLLLLLDLLGVEEMARAVEQTLPLGLGLAALLELGFGGVFGEGLLGTLLPLLLYQLAHLLHNVQLPFAVHEVGVGLHNGGHASGARM